MQFLQKIYGSNLALIKLQDTKEVMFFVHVPDPQEPRDSASLLNQFQCCFVCSKLNDEQNWDIKLGKTMKAFSERIGKAKKRFQEVCCDCLKGKDLSELLIQCEMD